VAIYSANYWLGVQRRADSCLSCANRRTKVRENCKIADMTKRAFVYLIASKKNGTLYIGVTSNLVQRVFQHRESLIDGFTKKYGCYLLVWFEEHQTMDSAILREKQLKAGNRARKISLIEMSNPDWLDLYFQIL
jgi:putative endonuclease